MKIRSTYKNPFLWAVLVFAGISLPNLADTFTCDSCDHAGLNCLGFQECNGYEGIDCEECDFKCYIMDGGTKIYGLEHHCKVAEP